MQTLALTVNGVRYAGQPVEFSASTQGVSGVLVDGGICDAQGPWQGKVVLCQRGSISFYDKVQNAQASGAVAAVIYNNEPGALFATLGAGNSSSIAAIGLSQQDGAAVVAQINGSLSGDVKSILTPGASGYEAWDGTSMATPHVAGIAALIWRQLPQLSHEELRAGINQTALDLGSAGRDNDFGHGLIQAQAAYQALQSGNQCSVTETPESSCSDGIDNDCDGLLDSQDSDCQNGGGGVCDLGQKADACTSDADCCSKTCRGKPGANTCK